MFLFKVHASSFEFISPRLHTGLRNRFLSSGRDNNNNNRNNNSNGNNDNDEINKKIRKSFLSNDDDSKGPENIMSLFSNDDTSKLSNQKLKNNEVDDFLFNFSDQIQNKNQKELIDQNKNSNKDQNKTWYVEEEGKNDANNTGSILKMLSISKITNKASTQKTSNLDVAKLLSDFLSPSEELYRIHIHASYNNTIVTLTNSKKDVLITTSGGLVGFKKAQRGGYEAAHQAAISLVEKTKEKNINIKNVEILINGFGPGRDAAFKAIASPENSWDIKRITDSTPLPFDGCRPRKIRRL